MLKPLRLAAAAAAMAFTATWVDAQSSTVVFQGLTHTAIGSATLSLDKDRGALDVHTFDPEARDGVAVKLADAVSWTARLEATRSDALPLSVSWHALAEGRRISSASMRQSGDHFELRASFTGATDPTYSAHVYNDGRLVGSIGNLPSQTHIVVPEGFCETFGSVGLITCRFVSEFHNAVNGQCLWRFLWGPDVAVRLPNGVTLTGNELRLVEEVRPAGHYPYLGFDRVLMQSNAQPLRLLSEGAR